MRALPHAPRLAHTPAALGMEPITDVPPALRGRLLVTLGEIADHLLPLHEDSIRKLADGEWQRRGIVRRTADVRTVMVSLPGLVAWSMGAESERDSRVRLQSRVSELEQEVRLLRDRLALVAQATESAARIASGGATERREA